MSILKVKTALETVLPNDTHHLRAPAGTVKYIVWAESGQIDDEWADNTLIHQTISGTADYYTNIEYDANADKIQVALSNADIVFSLIAVEYIDEHKRTHYTWQWSVICELGDLYG